MNVLVDESAPAAGTLARVTKELKQELSALEKNARDAAQRRLRGTRLEKLVERFPAQLEDEVDALLGRLGLVRKARVPAVVVDTGAPVAVVEPGADLVGADLVGASVVAADVVAADVVAAAPTTPSTKPAKKKRA